MTKILVGTYEKIYNLLPNSYFDLVICNDVIEHMIDHESFFNTIKMKMHQDSYIIGSIPNVRFFPNLFQLLIKKDWKYTDVGVLDKTHLRFFTEKSLRRLFFNHGFLIEQLSGINGMGFYGLGFKYLAHRIIFYFLGNDCRYPQFAFRIKPFQSIVCTPGQAPAPDSAASCGEFTGRD